LSVDASELPVAAATARLSAIKANHLCTKENIQIHGGMGFTWEFDCHLYYRRAKLLALTLGGEPEWQDRLIDRLRRQRPNAEQAAQ
jgi:alkylation response protein AidB-like acyl-CoA dehydrogenase